MLKVCLINENRVIKSIDNFTDETISMKFAPKYAFSRIIAERKPTTSVSKTDATKTIIYHK